MEWDRVRKAIDELVYRKKSFDEFSDEYWNDEGFCIEILLESTLGTGWEFRDIKENHLKDYLTFITKKEFWIKLVTDYNSFTKDNEKYQYIRDYWKVGDLIPAELWQDVEFAKSIINSAFTWKIAYNDMVNSGAITPIDDLEKDGNIDSMIGGYFYKQGTTYYDRSIESFSKAISLLPQFESCNEEQRGKLLKYIKSRAIANKGVVKNGSRSGWDLINGIKYLDAALEDYNYALDITQISEEREDLLYYRGDLYYYYPKYKECRDDITRAIEMSTDDKRKEKMHNQLIRFFDEIKDYTYSKREDIIEVEIPKTIKSIGKNAFYGCRSLEKITLPLGLTSLGEEAFSGFNEYPKLESITIPGTLKIIPTKAFFRCGNLKNVIIENGVEVIEDNAFQETAIESIVFPDSIKKIKNGAFYGCSLNHITIGKKVSIKENAIVAGRRICFTWDYETKKKKAGVYIFDQNGVEAFDEKSGKNVTINWILQTGDVSNTVTKTSAAESPPSLPDAPPPLPGTPPPLPSAKRKKN